MSAPTPRAYAEVMGFAQSRVVGMVTALERVPRVGLVRPWSSPIRLEATIADLLHLEAGNNSATSQTKVSGEGRVARDEGRGDEGRNVTS